jgi:hypothetical protein
MPEWLVANARLTVFVMPDAVVPPGLWQAIVGEEPETSVTQRASATRIETGPYAEGKLTLQVQPIRIDWVHEAAGMGDGGQSATLGIFPGAAEPLVQLAHRWVQSDRLPSTQRMALGFVLISPTPDRQTGYEELRQFIDGVPTAPDATDFSYQVNRPRSSATHIDGLRVNRLSKWSVGAYHFVTLGAGLHPIEGPLQPHLRLELDINTSADFQGLIPREAAVSVIDDLLGGAREICEHGNRF